MAVLTVQLGLMWQKEKTARLVEARGRRGKIFKRHVKDRESSNGLDSDGVE